MILPALVDYYERLASDPESGIAPFGWSRQKIGFIIVLNSDGTLHDLDPPPDNDDRRFTLVVPGQSKPSGSGINPCFLWDNAAYLLGVVPDGKTGKRAKRQFEATRAYHAKHEPRVEHAWFTAVCRFLCSWQPEDSASEMAKRTKGFGVFRIRGARRYVHEEEAIAAYWNRCVQEGLEQTRTGMSLLNGANERLARLHEPKIKGLGGRHTAGRLLASFNLDAFESYSKTQGYNAPVGVHDAFRYCTALNRLLVDRRRKVRVGDATTIFWAARPHEVEDITGYLIGGVEDEDTVRRVEAFLRSVRRGVGDSSIDDASTRFFVLGLAPNVARISVRFWFEGTVQAFSDRIRRHVIALDVAGAPESYSVPSIRRIVAETAVPKAGWPDEARIPPVLAGEVARAILTGTPYPRSLLTGVVRRIRVEGFADPETRKDWRIAMHRRASILKACLVASGSGKQEETPVSLNENHPNGAYQLGRLFAILEKTQMDAFQGGLNASIRDRYLGAASATPSTVYPRLLRLHSHHLGKLEHVGHRVNVERLVSSICDRIDAFPPHLPIEGQGLFFLGYYQQRQDLYTSKRGARASKGGTET